MPVEALKRYTASQIGYQTIGRSRMAGILGIAGLGILLVGLVAGRIEGLKINQRIHHAMKIFSTSFLSTMVVLFGT